MKESTRKKLDKLYQKAEELDKRIKQDTVDRKNLLHQISEIENAEIFSMIRKNKLSLDVVCGDLELGQKLRDAGITFEDINELLAPNAKEPVAETTSDMKERNTL